MTYDAFRENEQWCVYKLDKAKHPTGLALGRHNTDSAAKEQIRALVASERTKAYIAPRPVSLFQRHKAGVTVIKGSDGLRYMFLVTSNSYQDREHETITTKALQAYVDAAWAVEGKCLPRNTLELWHTKAPIGDIVWCDMEGPFLLEWARERPNKAIKLRLHGKSYRTTVKQVWDAIEALDISWGASHGFKYPENAKTKDGTYHYIAKFESSVLPLDAAANPYTYAEVLNDMTRTDFLEDFLSRVGLGGAGTKSRKGVRAVNEQLRKQGLQHKAKKPIARKGLLEDLTAKIDEIIGEITDGDTTMLRDKLLAALAETLTTAAATEVDPATAVEDVATEYMEDDTEEEVVTETVDPALMEKQLKSLMTLLPRLITTQEKLADDNAATRDAVLAMAEVVKGLQDTAKVPDLISSLETRIKGVESKFTGAPRRASTSGSTAINDDKLTEQIKKQSERFEELLPGSGVQIRAE